MSSLPPHLLASTVVGELRLPSADRTVTPWIVERGDWEPAESAVLVALLRAGMSVVDVGAHIGFLTLLAAARVGPRGRVLAVEAHPDNAALLRDNVARNAPGIVEVVHGAAWRAGGETVPLTVSEGNSGDNRAYDRADAAERIEVETVTLDALLGDRHVDVVKVDVQGTDHIALEGMRATIARCRPIVMVEFWPEGIDALGDNPRDVLAFYQELGYELSMMELPRVGDETPLEQIVDAARAQAGGFCTLILQPRFEAVRSAAAEAVGGLIARGPIAPGRSPLGPAGPLARRLVLRAIQPYTAHQRTVDGEIAAALADIERRLTALEQRARGRSS